MCRLTQATPLLISTLPLHYSTTGLYLFWCTSSKDPSPSQPTFLCGLQVHCRHAAG